MEEKQMNLAEMNREIVAMKKQMEQMRKAIEEDLEFAIRTELAWQNHDRGDFTSYSKDEFLKKIDNGRISH